MASGEVLAPKAAGRSATRRASQGATSAAVVGTAATMAAFAGTSGRYSGAASSSAFGGEGRHGRWLGPYVVGRTIGEGMCSKVKIGWHAVSGQEVALKVLDPETFRSVEVQQELKILGYFGEPRNRHPNVTGLVEVLHDVELQSKHGEGASSYGSRRVSVIVTEYMDSGDLFSYLSSGIPFDEETAKAVFQQLVRGLSHLHKHGVVHLDLKPENILLSKTGNVKITDFGLSEIVKPLRSHRRRSGNRMRPSRRLPGVPPGMTSAVSLTSLESMGTSSQDSASTMPNLHRPSPLVNFFPPRVNGIQTRGGRPLSSSFGSHRSGESNEEQRPEDDEELFAAISSGKTREQLLAETESMKKRMNSTKNLVQEPGPRIRLSHSLTNLAVAGGMGRKSKSYTSVSSLESDWSLHSRNSNNSRTSAKFRTPKLVVNSRSGTLSYQAPEVAKGNYDGSKADVYSLGVVLHVMLYGVLPYEEGEWIRRRDYYEELGSREKDQQSTPSSGGQNLKSENELESSGDESDPIPEWSEPKLLQRDISVSPEAKDLLANMLFLAPEQRFSLKDVMRHPWVDAAKIRGSVQKVAAVVKRRAPYVKQNLKHQAMARKARKRGYIDSSTDIFDD